MSSRPTVLKDGWQKLTELTAARIALGRAGVSLPTEALLSFGADHAMARDAIHAVFDVEGLKAALGQMGLNSLEVRSRAATRAEYLRRPDLGRRLDETSRLSLVTAGQIPQNRLTVVVADGLSALAPMRHAAALLEHLRPGLGGWALDDVVLAKEARVALGDEVGEVRGAEAVLMLIGERPGLKSPDSLGAYLTYRPRVGCNDAERNCISNIRPEGLGLQEAASRLSQLLGGARALGASGVLLKEGAGLLEV